MTAITIIGSGNMADAIGARAVRHGHTVELMSRNPARSQALADRIGDGVTVGEYGARPTGDLVIVAVLFASAVDVVTHYGDALSGTTLVDITNPFDDDGTGLVTSPGRSIAEQLAAATPDDTHVVKAFNTIFRGVLAGEEPVDAFFAGDDAGAKARVSAFVESLGLRPRDVGGIGMAHALEWAGLMLVGVAGNGAGFDVALEARVV